MYDCPTSGQSVPIHMNQEGADKMRSFLDCNFPPSLDYCAQRIGEIEGRMTQLIEQGEVLTPTMAVETVQDMEVPEVTEDEVETVYVRTGNPDIPVRPEVKPKKGLFGKR